MVEPRFESSIAASTLAGPALVISDESGKPLSRVVGEGREPVRMGEAAVVDGSLVLSTSPGEWTVFGDRGDVDLTHVRAILRLTGADTVRLLAKVCSLDFGDHMFRNGAAARTSVAGTATEVVRNDIGDERSYLLIVSRSFAAYLHGVLVDQASEFGVTGT